MVSPNALAALSRHAARRARKHRLTEGGVQRARQRMLVGLPFGVPLHADDKLRIIVIAQTFDHTVGGRRLYNQSLAQAIHTLPMQ